MRYSTLAVVAAVGTAVAQRPTNTSICDYYTTALLMNNTAANQMTLLTLVVNTAVIGNYTKPNVGIKVPGILAAGTYNGTAVDLLPYFDGGFASTNNGGMTGGVSNFLDGGGAAPLMKNMPADDTTSNQYFLLTHLYEYFGGLLGCTMQGGADYPAYGGEASMYSVHKFMDLSNAEVGYFIEQVAMSAASFGVATDDLMVVGTALNSLFGVRCAPETIVVPAQGPQLNSICIDSTCPLSPNSTCASYAAAMEPAVANSTLVPNTTSSAASSGSGSMSTGTAASSGSATKSASASASSAAAGGAATVGISVAAVMGGFAALLL